MNYFVYVHEDGDTEVTAVADDEADKAGLRLWADHYRCRSFDDVCSYLRDMTGLDEGRLERGFEEIRKLKSHQCVEPF